MKARSQGEGIEAMADDDVLVRRDAWALPPGDETLAWYGRAVEIMKKRQTSDPTSWSYQAAIHGTRTSQTLPLQKCCQHGSWYFLPWHRMYVLYFEQVVRAVIVDLGGPADWALPYWDYTSPAPANTIPTPFRDSGSPLYVAERRTSPYDINAGAGLHPDTVSVTRALETIPFEPPTRPITGFAGQVVNEPIHFNSGFGALEQQPHNVVHGAIGGDGGLMAYPNTAAQDPIFWLHHANIDRLWASWTALGGGRANSTDPRWTNKAFSFFDPSKHQVTKLVQEVESTGALRYSYDRLERLEADLLEQPLPARSSQLPSELVGGTSEPVVLTGQTTSRAVPIDARARDAALADLRSSEPRQVILALDDITAKRDPASLYHVYVNLPDGASAEEARAHLAGTLSFFGIEQAAQPAGDAHAHPYNVAFDITRVVGRLAATGRWEPDHVNVVFRPADFLPPKGVEQVSLDTLPEHEPVSVGRISVHYG